MKQALALAIAIFICQAATSEELTNQVTFKTAKPAPTDFTAWTFHWVMPEIAPGATLKYVVLQPDGKEFFRHTTPSNQQTGRSIRSDFSMGFTGGDPQVFYGKDIVFTFMVDKGEIKFPDNPSFTFEFSRTVKAIKQENAEPDFPADGTARHR